MFVVESHTHFRPEGYQGPKADRIRLIEDKDGDGVPESVSTFYEGTTFTMGLAFHPGGALYVSTRNEVFRLHDKDGDGRADGPRETLVKLETPGNYPHNGLSGFAFDAAGLVYFGLGENLGADYKLVGRDGKTLTGGGEGGNIYRCLPDGSKLERVATGFWNPFAQAFDAFGRLFIVDNDPDSRPPCRLVHVVPGGDYGYRFRNGRKGLHPFTAWNGELPGTLPMAAGTGEAPSGVLVYESDQFPADYRGAILSTSWGDHRIERFRLKPAGALFKGVSEPIVSGGEDFRPVAIATAPDGSVYFSDWVDKSYNLHGKGRVWRLSAKNPPRRVVPKDDEAALVDADRPTREAAAARLLKTADGRSALSKAVIGHDDPRVPPRPSTPFGTFGCPCRAKTSARDVPPWKARSPTPSARRCAIAPRMSARWRSGAWMGRSSALTSKRPLIRRRCVRGASAAVRLRREIASVPRLGRRYLFRYRPVPPSSRALWLGPRVRAGRLRGDRR